MKCINGGVRETWLLFLFYSIQFKDKNIKGKNIVHMHFVDEYFSRYIHSLCNRP